MSQRVSNVPSSDGLTIVARGFADNMTHAILLAVDNPDAAAKAMEYYSLLKCAVPELDKQVKAIKKARLKVEIHVEEEGSGADA